MQKHYSFLSGFFLVMFLISSFWVNAQNIQLQGSSFPSLPATSCTNTQLDVSVLKLCINAAHNGNTFSISGNTITVSLDYSLGPICLGALSMNTENINLGMIPAGTYSVVIQGVLNSSVVSTINTSLTVNSCCSAVPGFTPSQSTICVGDSIYFNNTSTGASGQQWYENNVATVTSANYGKRYNTIGVYTIKLVVAGTACSDSITKTINVTAPPSVNLGSDRTICPGDQTVLDAGTGRDSIVWSDQSTLRNLIVTNQGTYYVEVFKNGCSDKDTVTVSFYNVIDVDLGNDTVICAGDTLELDATLTGATYKWQNNTTQSSFKVYAAGTYHLERTDANGCMARDTITVAVDTNCNTSGLGENGAFREVSVYPNPVKNRISVNLPLGSSKVFTLEVYDVQGKLIKSKNIEADSAGRLSANVSAIKPGVYTLRLMSKDENFTAHWIKE
ncbi:T9SS type A sorting domain-containing protein [Owenweeksia hongkongensis]|uniref:T9SS type A sorting domain-containing protein n=1 Tax=Owenweeksia hongkongensis TaxID=253245 RepID=UPI003A8D66CF